MTDVLIYDRYEEFRFPILEVDVLKIIFVSDKQSTSGEMDHEAQNSMMLLVRDQRCVFVPL